MGKKVTGLILIILALLLSSVTLSMVHADGLSPGGTVGAVEANPNGTTFSPLTSSWVQSAPSSPLGNPFPADYTFVGDKVYVNIVISSVPYSTSGTGDETVATTDIYGWSLNLNWSPSNLSLKRVREGTYLTQDGSTLFLAPAQLIDNVNGMFRGGIADAYADSQVLSMEGANAVSEVSGGILLQLQFTVTGRGTGNVTVSNVVFYDSASDAEAGNGVAATPGSSVAVTLNIQTVPLTVSSVYGNSTPPVGTTNYLDGQTVAATVPSQVIVGNNIFACSGWTGTGSVYETTDANGNPIYHGTGNSISFVMDSTQGTSTLIWNWINSGSAKLLTVTSSYGNPTPSVGNHIYVSDTSVAASVSSPATVNGNTYICTGWTGTGSVAPSGNVTGTTFTVTTNSSITWNWQLVQTPVQTKILPNGVVSAVLSGTEDASNWSFGPTPDPIGTTFSVDFRIDNASGVWGWAMETVTWNPAILRLTNVQEGNYLKNNHQTFFIAGYLDNAHGDIAGGIGCAIGDSYANETATSGLLATLTFTITGYGNANIHIGNVTLTTYIPVYKNGIEMDSVSSHPIVNEATVTVYSSFPTFSLTTASGTSPINGEVLGNPIPFGAPNYNSGTSVTASVTSPFAIEFYNNTITYQTTYTCVGWTGTGSVPSSGTGTSVTFVITENSSITWLWETGSTSLAPRTQGTPPTGVLSAVQGGTDNVSNWSYGPNPDSIGTNFTVDIRIANASNVWGWSIGTVSWNPAVVQLTAVQEGNYLKDYCSTFFIGNNPSLFDNVNGQIDGGLACALEIGSEVNASTGVLVSLTFQIIGYGTANICIGNATLRNTDDAAFSPTTNQVAVTVLSSTFDLPESSWGALGALVSSLIAFTAFATARKRTSLQNHMPTLKK